VEDRTWYPVRLQVTEAAIKVWVDDEMLIDLPVPGHTFTVQPKWGPVQPFGIATSWTTGGAVRDIQLRRCAAPPQDGVVVLLGQDVWKDSNVDLVEGRSYEIAAVGRWGHDHRGSIDPGGDPGSPTDGLPLPSALAYSLIGRVGPAGTPFAIGGGVTLVADQGGRLFLQMNDSELGDNVGSLRVSIGAAAEKAGPSR
jgi:hypothetical protein